MMEKHYRVFAWVGFACEAALILRQIFGPSHLFSSPGNALTIILVDALPILIFLTHAERETARRFCTGSTALSAPL